ncbi:MAG: LacI family DNA-binding transcriptional regulator [Selenomonadaceae bacterium]|nr:LacI family DNA-binding transcriptional regulator [Selenomonadaceae bacterium]
MVTIKQIAEMCGVSRGTVDRVLNNRGNVKQDKKELILSTAKKLNYVPNPAGRALVSRQNKPTVGIVLPAKGLSFFDDVIEAMKKAEEKYNLFGLNTIWRLTEGYDVELQCEALDELMPRIQGLIINPINSPEVRERLLAMRSKGIFIVTVNNDIHEAGRHCYVGSDYRNGGETAAALLRLICPQGGRIGVMLGSFRMFGHQERLNGFQSVIEQDEKFSIVKVEEDNDDEICAYEKVKAMLEQHEDIGAMFFASSGGAYGACRAIESLARRKKITVVAFDTVPGVVEMMKAGVIAATIYQHPRRQGQKAMQLVYDSLVNGIEPDRELHIMTNDIRILQNL